MAAIDDELVRPDYSFSADSKRKQEEEEFHDHARDGADERPNRRFYAIDGPSKERNRLLLREVCARGGRILDYGCGDGEFAIWAAGAGALVSAIDISAISVENASAAAERAGVSDRISFRVMDAEHMAFEDDSFDAVCILGVLHHLDLRTAYSELARVTRPDGFVVATEATRHNPLIHAYRKRTPDLRTEWELQHILGKADVELAGQYFRLIEVEHYHLATLAAIPLRHRRRFPEVLAALNMVDQRLLMQVPGLRWLSWMTLFTMRQPISGPERRDDSIALARFS